MGDRSRRQCFGAVLAAVFAMAGLVVLTSGAPAGANPVSSVQCPATATAVAPGQAYPPGIGAPEASQDASSLEGCTAPWAPTIPPASTVDVVVDYAFPGLPDEACTVTDVIASITGTPVGAGYGLAMWNPADDTPIRLASGTADGFFQQYGAPQGMQIPSSGAVFESQENQPADGTYTSTAAFDPAGLTTDGLLADGLAMTIVVINEGDQIGDVTIEVVYEDETCPSANTTPTTGEETTTTTTTSTTTSTSTTSTPSGSLDSNDQTPASPVARPVSAEPTLTG